MDGSRNRASLCEGFHEGDLEGGLLYWGPKKRVKQGSEMGVCFHRGLLLGNVEVYLFLRAFLFRGIFMRFQERCKCLVNGYLSP
jgi:hypothetical protein